MQSAITHISLALILAPSLVFAEERIAVGVGLSDERWMPFVVFTNDDVSSEDGGQENDDGFSAANRDACHLIEDGVLITRTSRVAGTACIGFIAPSADGGVRTRRR